MFVRKTTEVRIADFAERSAVDGSVAVSSQLAERCRVNLGWDTLCDKAKMATKEALYWQMKATGAPKDALRDALEVHFPTSSQIERGRATKERQRLALARDLEINKATLAAQQKEIEQLRAQLATAAARADQVSAQLNQRLRVEGKLARQRLPQVCFGFAGESFCIATDAIEKRGGLFAAMLSDEFASPFDEDGVIQLQWPNLLASDFSLLVSWYEDALPRFVSVERLERLLPYLDYLDLSACAADLGNLAQQCGLGTLPSVAQNFCAMGTRLEALEQKADIFAGTFQRHFKPARQFLPYEATDRGFFFSQMQQHHRTQLSRASAE